jgi:diacylglycerol kinase (ATP)
VLWNPQARLADESQAVRDRLTRDPRYELRETSNAEDAQRAACQAAADSGVQLLVAAGGDGTVHSVVNGMSEAGGKRGSPALAILPLGTANDLCRGLRIPLDPLESLQLLERPRCRRMDLVRVEAPDGRHWFANLASGGNSHRVSESLTDEMKQRWGAWCYLRGAVDVLNDLTGYRLQVSCDGGPTEEFTAWNFLVANGDHIGGVFIAPGADPGDGLLDLIIIQDGTLVDLAQLAAGVVLRDYLQHESIVHRRVRQLSISCQPETRVVADGETIVGQPLEFSVVPHALEAVVGPSFGSTNG